MCPIDVAEHSAALVEGSDAFVRVAKMSQEDALPMQFRQVTQHGPPFGLRAVLRLAQHPRYKPYWQGPRTLAVLSDMADVQ